MEAELKGLGALRLDVEPDRVMTPGSKEGTIVRDKGKGVEKRVEQGAEESDDEEDVDIDYNLAKNLLESFRSQTL